MLLPYTGDDNTVPSEALISNVLKGTDAFGGGGQKKRKEGGKKPHRVYMQHFDCDLILHHSG